MPIVHATGSFPGSGDSMEHMEGEFGNSGKRNGPSKTAELMAMHRKIESMLPEDERICYDPYAVHFCDPKILKFIGDHPQEAKEKADEVEELFPGLGNSIRARVRYFDDFLMASVDKGIRQLVILGAGYDTRAYRIANLKGNVRVFEIDHPDTQHVKMKNINEIFGTLPDHIIYIPIDFERENLSQILERSGYSRSKKTLFILEGLIMYIPPAAVDETLEFIARNSGKGSMVIFDYYPRSLVDGTDQGKVAGNIRDFTRMVGEPLQFGIPDGAVARFLAERGFTVIENVTSREYQRLYFHGKNAHRPLCDYLSFVSAEVR